MANFAFGNLDRASRDAAAPAVPPAAYTVEELDARYAQPAATSDQMDRMSYEDTIAKTFAGFVVLLLGAAIGWFVPVLALPAALVGFALALVNTFKKKPSAVLVLAYSAVEGVFVGGISHAYAYVWDGIIPVAVFGTLGVVAVTLALFASGKVRASARATKVFLVALLGYAAFSLVNLGLMVFGVTDSFNGIRDTPLLFGIPLGVILGVVVVLLAAYSLVLDFDHIKRGVEAGAPRAYGWTGAFGIIVTVVWLYLEILRLVSYFMPRN